MALLALVVAGSLIGNEVMMIPAVTYSLIYVFHRRSIWLVGKQKTGLTPCRQTNTVPTKKARISGLFCKIVKTIKSFLASI
jgi:hypothetical protein